LAEHLNAGSPATTAYLNQLHSLGASPARAWSLVDSVVTREALTIAVNDVFLLFALLFFAMIPVIWMAKPPFGSAGAATVH
jgi:DHA2 family multidrug resistance protein